MYAKFGMWLNALVLGLGALAGAMSLFTDLFGQGTAQKVVAGISLAAIFLGAINGALHNGSNTALRNAAKMLILGVGAATLLLALPHIAGAQPLERLALRAQHRAMMPPRRPIMARPSAGSLSIQQIVKGLQQFTVADLTAAAADAAGQTPPDTRHGQCWTALIPLAQSGVGNPLPAGLGAAQLVQKFFDDKALVTNGLPDSVVQACALTVYDMTLSFNELAALIGLKALPVPAL